MSSAAGRGVAAFAFLVTQLLNFFLTVNHFVYSQTHPEEMIQWSWIYLMLMAFMFVGMIAHVFFWAVRKANQKEYERLEVFAHKFAAISVFTAFLFGSVQASEVANYSALNTDFPLWQIALMMSLNIVHLIVKAPEHL